MQQTYLLASEQFSSLRAAIHSRVLPRTSTVNILDGSNISLAAVVWNGHLGLFLDPLVPTSIAQHIFTRFHKSSSLLNPVVGMRFDPANPKLTIGALDPNDYEGTINWVPLNQTPDPEGDYFNTFGFDGVKGYDGKFVPYTGILNAALDSCKDMSLRSDRLLTLLDPVFLSISLPNVDTYFGNTNSTGPVPRPIGLINDTGLIEYNCTSNSSTSTSSSGPPQSPYVALTATINGVDYPIDSTDNLLRPPSLASSLGFCPVGIRNRSDTAQPSIVLGLPFLRSVYVYVYPSSFFTSVYKPISWVVINPARIDSQRTTVQDITVSPSHQGRTGRTPRFRKHRRRPRPTALNACLLLHLPRRR